MKFSIDDEDGSIYTSVFLNNYRPWYKRVWVAIRYVFGYKSKYGQWDCFEMKPEDHDRFIRMLERSKLLHQGYRQTKTAETI